MPSPAPASSPPRPHPNTYWVIPGRLLAGEYPGAPTEQQAREKLADFLDCGINRFLDLTGEGELAPYAPLVMALAAPRGLTVRHQRCALRDMGIPDRPEQMAAILTQLDRWLAAERSVYVHCWGGIGRTGTVIGCHLVEQGLDGTPALAYLAALWRSVSDEKRRRYPCSPQTREQQDYVRHWIPLPRSG